MRSDKIRLPPRLSDLLELEKLFPEREALSCPLDGDEDSNELRLRPLVPDAQEWKYPKSKLFPRHAAWSCHSGGGGGGGGGRVFTNKVNAVEEFNLGGLKDSESDSDSE